MNRKTLLIIALVFSGIGLIALFFVSSYLDDHPEQSSFLEISGEVKSVRVKNGVTIISIDPKALPVVAFDPIEIEKGMEVTLRGHLQEYKGKVEFVVTGIGRKAAEE